MLLFKIFMSKMLYSKTFAVFSVLFLSFCFFSNKTFAQGKNDVIVVLPFENKSSLPQYNWVGESFAESLASSFGNCPGRDTTVRCPGLTVVQNEERKLVQQRLNLPLTTIPSLATSIKLANAARANLLVVGKYSVTPASGELATSLRVTAQVIRVQDGMMSGDQTPDGTWLAKKIDLGDALANLQTLQGQISYQVLYQRDRALPFSQNDFVETSRKIPAQAFEAYIKGMLTPDTATTPEGDFLRPRFFKKALELYTKERGGETYSQAALELGHFYLARKDQANALEYFSRIQKGAPYYYEAAFYVGLLQWQLGNPNGAVDTLRQLAEEAKLAPIYNNLGAIEADTARKNKEQSNLLTEGKEYLRQAVNSGPNDPNSLFNYGYTLFLSGNYVEAAQNLRPVLAANPRDGYAYFLLAKAMEKTGDTTAATSFDENARRYLTNYAKLQIEWQKSQTTNEIPVRVRETFNRNDNFVASSTAQNDSVREPEDILKKSRDLYKAGRDDEALADLRRVQTTDPMNAEAYFLIGSIQLRRGELEAAVSNLKTAIFWKNDIVEAYIALTKIFLEKNDSVQARTYIKTAIQLAPENQEVISLYRRVEMGGK